MSCVQETAGSWCQPEDLHHLVGHSASVLLVLLLPLALGWLGGIGRGCAAHLDGRQRGESLGHRGGVRHGRLSRRSRDCWRSRGVRTGSRSTGTRSGRIRAWIGGGRNARGGFVAGSLSVADTCLPVRDGLARTWHGLEFDNRVVAKYFALRHDVEVIAVSVLVGPADGRAPLRVAVVRAQVRDHDDYARPGRFSRSTGRARRRAGRRKLIALPTATAAPARRQLFVVNLQPTCQLAPSVSKSACDPAAV